MHATLTFDSHRLPAFQGSCGVVTHYLRKSLQALGYKVAELYVPLTDKTSVIRVPRIDRPSPEDVRVFFEELFVRAEDTPEFWKTKNVSFFNLLATEGLERQGQADLVLMNSKFMVDAFKVEMSERGAALPVRLGWVPLPLPLFDFPKGYPSGGGAIGRGDFRALARDAHVGHAVRPHKMDCFATLSILHHLNEGASKAGTKPFSLVVPQVDFDRCEQAIDAIPLPKDVLDALVPIPYINNRSMIWIMSQSSFGLCYDHFVEPFGYYPIESVYVGCPVFANGAGNVRHVLPKGSGIFTHETMAMHFGSLEERVAAYQPVATAIARTVSRPRSKACGKGADYIRKHHRPQDFTAAMERHLHALFHERPPRRPPPRFLTSPYLRLADWERGRFVTDHGNIDQDPRAPEWKQLLAGKAPRTDMTQDDLDSRVLSLR